MIGSFTLDQLRVLIAIADTGSFSAAGRRLGRVQSAISQAVATLEDVQGLTLFDRSGFRPTLTDMGRVLVAQARSVLESAARFDAVAAGTREGVEPELAVAIDPLVPTAALIDSLHALRAAFPHLPVTFSTEGLGGAERRPRRGDAALAFCILLLGVPDDVVALPLLGINLMPVVSPAHPLATLGRPATADDPAGARPTRPPRSRYAGRSELWHRRDQGLALRRSRSPARLSAGGLGVVPDARASRRAASGRRTPRRAGDRERSGPRQRPAHHLCRPHADRMLGRAGAWLLGELQTRLA